MCIEIYISLVDIYYFVCNVRKIWTTTMTRSCYRTRCSGGCVSAYLSCWIYVIGAICGAERLGLTFSMLCIPTFVQFRLPLFLRRPEKKHHAAHIHNNQNTINIFIQMSRKRFGWFVPFLRWRKRRICTAVYGFLFNKSDRARKKMNYFKSWFSSEMVTFVIIAECTVPPVCVLLYRKSTKFSIVSTR